jgi:AbrB family looped-hinge helix DNA binding protein
VTMHDFSPAETKILKAKVNENGRVVIPAEIRAQLNLKPGMDLLFRAGHDSVEIYTRLQAIRRVQDYFRKNTPPGVNLSDELIAMRREEFEKEEADYRRYTGQKTRKKAKRKPA